MNGLKRTVYFSVFLLLLTFSATAERAPEKKETADYILSGKVVKVFKRVEGRRNEYIFQLHIQEVHKGEAVKKNELFYIYCFQTTPSLVPVAEESGHKEIPKEGDVIKAYIREKNGRHEANYSDWFELIKDKE